MRRTKEQTAESKARILSTAARLLRERGPDGVSLADVMAAAGMTQGGFYRHFTSKADLLVAATRYAFDDVRQRYDLRQREAGAAAALRDYVEVYLSKAHLDHPGSGCPMAAVGSDAGRITDVLGADFAAGAADLIDRVAAGLAADGAAPGEAERAEAIRRLTRLVGTVIVARAVGDRPLREEIVTACKRDLADR